MQQSNKRKVRRALPTHGARQSAEHGCNGKSRFATTYFWLHFILVVCCWGAAAMETYPRFFHEDIYGILSATANGSSILVVILPLVSIRILFLSSTRGKEYIFLGISDVMLCVLHAVALFTLILG